MPVTYFWDRCPSCMHLCKFILKEVTPEGVAIYKCAGCGQEVMK